MRYPPREIARNFLSVCFGVAGSIGVFYFLFMASALLPQTFNSTGFLMILLGIASFTGGFCTAAYATRQKFILSFITTITLVLLYGDFFDVNFTARNYPTDYIQVGTITLLSITGGIAGALPSRIDKDKPTSSGGS